jgi:dihydroorotate dehydrogenase
VTAGPIRAAGSLARAWLMRLPPETAHRVAIAALKLAPAGPPPSRDPRLAVDAFGLRFPSPLGLAAGFDKNATVPAALLALGFGFVEVGTLTPRPQAGNPMPRLFRLPADAALINRLGFNNDGFEAGRANLARRPIDGIVGVNFGPNKDAVDRIADFVLGVNTFVAAASYFTINISSPNTPGLRDLQRREALDELVARVIEARDGVQPFRPVLVKIAPDLDLRGLDDMVAIGKSRRVDGLIVSNTTLARPSDLLDPAKSEAGGLSGRPLFAASTRLLAQARLRCEGAISLIGCGGVENTATALAKIEAGANLVQFYTGFVYRGPAAIDEILDGLAEEISSRGVAKIGRLVGVKASDWARA